MLPASLPASQPASQPTSTTLGAAAAAPVLWMIDIMLAGWLAGWRARAPACLPARLHGKRADPDKFKFRVGQLTNDELLERADLERASGRQTHTGMQLVATR